MKKGFTLIELLAVIVILAIIALIAVPIVLNIIDNSKENANKRSIDMYSKAVQNAIAIYEINEKRLPTTYDEIKDYIEYSGSDVECGEFIIYDNGTFYLNNCKVENKLVENYSYGTPILVKIWEQEGNVIKGKSESGEVLYTLNVGDQISYDAYTGVDSSLLTYTATTTLTGNNSNENSYASYVDNENKVYTVTSADATRIWNVMGVQDGKILITASPLEIPLILAGQAGYNNGVTILNNIGAIYGHGKGAESGRSIELDDVEKITGIEATDPFATVDENSNYVFNTTMMEFIASEQNSVLVGSYLLASTASYYYNGPMCDVYDVIRVSATLNQKSLVYIDSMGIYWSGGYSNLGLMNSVKPVVILKSDVSLQKDNSTNIWKIK